MRISFGARHLNWLYIFGLSFSHKLIIDWLFTNLAVLGIHLLSEQHILFLKFHVLKEENILLIEFMFMVILMIDISYFILL